MFRVTILRASRNEGNAQISAIDVFRDDLFRSQQYCFIIKQYCLQYCLYLYILFVPLRVMN